MKTAYEVAVVGCGVIGSSAAYWLAREFGREVVAFEQHAFGHDRGASGDHSRIIRLSYHAPEYTALTPHTYACWREVEAESGMRLIVTSGGFDLAPVEAPENVEPYAAAMRTAAIPFDDIDGREAMRRHPQFRLDPDSRVLHQPETGLLDPRKAVHVNAALARARGAEILEQTPVRRLTPTADGVALQTDGQTFAAERVVIAADAWTNDLLRDTGVQVPLTITEEQVTYFATPNLKEFQPDRFPVWIWSGAESFYGFPVYGEVATKAGLDVGGDEATPENRSWAANVRPLDKLLRFLEARIPGSLGPILRTSTCLYAMPPDRDFIVDRLPEHPQITLVQGAAHGAKFASLLGRIAADLSISGRTGHPIARFALGRPALTDPAFPAVLKI